MGSYGIGPARIVAAAVEQFADEQGISWPRALAPFDAELVGLGKEEESREVAERLYEELREAGLDVLYDDRAASPGEKFADAELVGCPLRITAGRKSVEAGRLDAQVRRGREERSPRSRTRPTPPRSCGGASPTRRRLLGLDRSGPPPPETTPPAAASPVDDSQRDRLRQAGAAAGR